MTNKKMETLDVYGTDAYRDLSTYQKKEIESNVERFIKLVKFDYDTISFTKNVGNEARTFNVINRSKPLLSPSRLLSPMVEHQYGSIPAKNMLKPRLMGQLVHRLIEVSIFEQETKVLTRELIDDGFPNDFLKLNELGNKELTDMFIEDINYAVSAFFKFIKKENIEVVAVEKHVASQQFHGYIDLCALKNYGTYKVPLIIDIKVSSIKEVKPEGISQLAIYRDILQKTAQCYILHYDKEIQTGKMKKVSLNSLETLSKCGNTLINIHRG